MTTIEKEKIKYLRGEGLGYKAIASRLELSENTVKGFCKRNKLGGVAAENKTNSCRQCGAVLEHTPGRRLKKFCSDRCRSAWWSTRAYLYKHKEENSRACAFCGRVFHSFQSKERKYCGRPCYMTARFGGERQ